MVASLRQLVADPDPGILVRTGSGVLKIWGYSEKLDPDPVLF